MSLMWCGVVLCCVVLRCVERSIVCGDVLRCCCVQGMFPCRIYIKAGTPQYSDAIAATAVRACAVRYAYAVWQPLNTHALVGGGRRWV